MEVLALELREKAHRICKEFLCGAWRIVSLKDFMIKPMSGGMSNYLYLCSLPPSYSCLRNEPMNVLLRLYGQLHDNGDDALVKESVIFTLLSERKLGPKLYGIFSGGRIEEYIPSRSLKTEELRDSLISKEIAVKMARIHRINAPICKEPKWMNSMIDRWLNVIQTDTVFYHLGNSDDQAKINKLLKYPLQNEFDWLRNVIATSGSPVVFCHNDLQEGNILYAEESKKKEKLVFIDFEYCSYNYRGFDVANHFCEYCYDYSMKDHPYFYNNCQKFPSREEQLTFIRAYLEELGGPYNNNMLQNNREEKLLKEVSIFVLASHFLWGLWSICQSQASSISFGYLDYALARFDAYFQHKKKMTFSNDL